jgi:pyridoxine kinase
MAILCEKADVITPNITEACILANENYIGEEITHEQALRLLEKLSLNQKRSVVITGISNKSSIESAVYDSKENDIFFAESAKSPITYPGTGDLFASILCGGITNEVSLKESAQFASDFISRAATFTSQFETDVNDGIAFESFIHELTEFKAPRG